MIGKISTKISDLGQKMVKKVAQNPLKQLPSLKKPLLVDKFTPSSKANSISFEAFLDVFELAQIQEATKNYTPIEFEPAKTLKEAHKMARKLGVKHLYFGKNNTLEVCNYFNEGLTKVKNAHLGLANIPKVISFCNLKKLNTFMVTYPKTDAIDIHENLFGVKKINSTIQDALKTALDGLCIETQDGIELPKFFAPKEELEYAQNLIRKFQKAPESLDYGSKVKLLSILETIKENTEAFTIKSIIAEKRLLSGKEILDEKDRTLAIKLSNKKFAFLFHEIGHLQDYPTKRALTIGRLASQSENQAELDKWLYNKKAQRIAYQVSSYAATGPAEFIAETYAKLLMDDNLSEEVIELYQQMNGPKIPYII